MQIHMYNHERTHNTSRRTHITSKPYTLLTGHRLNDTINLHIQDLDRHFVFKLVGALGYIIIYISSTKLQKYDLLLINILVLKRPYIRSIFVTLKLPKKVYRPMY